MSNSLPGRTARLSIIVPALNEAACIERSLGLLAPLRTRGVEVVLADGGSSDGTAERARPLVDRVVVSRRGRARQMNAGAGACSGEVLLFLHADTQLPALADELVRAALASGRSWGRFDVEIEGEPALLRLVAALMNLRSRWTGIATGDQAIFATRAAFEAAGRYPEIPLMEDVVLSRELCRRARPACLRARVRTSGRRWEAQGVLRTVVRMWWLRLRFFLGADVRRLAREYGYVDAD